MKSNITHNPYSSTNCMCIYEKGIKYILHYLVNSLIKNVVKSLFQIIRIIFLFVMIFINPILHAQEFISLQMCHDSAEINFPLANQKQKIQQIEGLKQANLSSKYLPVLSLIGKVSYQSEVVEIAIDVPNFNLNFPEMPKNQFSANIEINQILYDGGNIKAAKQLNEQTTAVELQKIEVDIYKIKAQITQLYFQGLLLQENKGILNLTHETIIEQRKVLSSAVNQGLVLASELDNLNAELLRLEQQIIELESAQKQVIKAIEILSCIQLASNIKLALPKLTNAINPRYFRPEHQLFLDQAQLLDASIGLINCKRMPTLGAFTNIGYGRPGYDFFNEDLHGYYLVGAQFKWKVWDWGHTNKEKQQLEVQKLMIEDNKSAFDKNMNITISETQVRQLKLEQLIKKDKDIIALQEKIRKRSAIQMKNGTKTSADYLRDLNTEKQARINLESRQIQLLQAKIDELTLLGSDVF